MEFPQEHANRMPHRTMALLSTASSPSTPPSAHGPVPHTASSLHRPTPLPCVPGGRFPQAWPRRSQVSHANQALRTSKRRQGKGRQRLYLRRRGHGQQQGSRPVASPQRSPRLRRSSAAPRRSWPRSRSSPPPCRPGAAVPPPQRCSPDTRAGPRPSHRAKSAARPREPQLPPKQRALSSSREGRGKKIKSNNNKEPRRCVPGSPHNTRACCFCWQKAAPISCANCRVTRPRPHTQLGPRTRAAWGGQSPHAPRGTPRDGATGLGLERWREKTKSLAWWSVPSVYNWQK